MSGDLKQENINLKKIITNQSTELKKLKTKNLQLHKEIQNNEKVMEVLMRENGISAQIGGPAPSKGNYQTKQVATQNFGLLLSVKAALRRAKEENAHLVNQMSLLHQKYKGTDVKELK